MNALNTMLSQCGNLTGLITTAEKKKMLSTTRGDVRLVKGVDLLPGILPVRYATSTNKVDGYSIDHTKQATPCSGSGGKVAQQISEV